MAMAANSRSPSVTALTQAVRSAQIIVELLRSGARQEGDAGDSAVAIPACQHMGAGHGWLQLKIH